MANYATLKAAIQAAIYENGNNEITGTALQQTLLSMISSLGDGYQFMGIATPSTNPGTPDENVFYLASTVGTYTNFGGLILADGEVAILKYNGTWTKDVTGAASKGQLDKESQKINKTSGTFEIGSINYLTGVNITNAKSVRTGYIPIYNDIILNIFFPTRTDVDWYIVKYLNGVYAGYEHCVSNGSENIKKTIIKDDTFNSVRLRFSRTSDWGNAEVALCGYVGYVSNSIMQFVVENTEQIKELQGYAVELEHGAVNYLNGRKVDDTKSIRTKDYIGVIGDNISVLVANPLSITFDYYVVKYKDYVYVGYSSGVIRAEQENEIVIEKDDTFNQCLVRFSRSEDITDAQLNAINLTVAGQTEYAHYKFETINQRSYIVPELHAGYYVHKDDGKLRKLAGWYYTDFVEVVPGEDFYYSFYGAQSASICAYDAEMNFVQALVYGIGEHKGQLKITNPKIKYVRGCTNNSSYYVIRALKPYISAEGYTIGCQSIYLQGEEKRAEGFLNIESRQVSTPWIKLEENNALPSDGVYIGRIGDDVVLSIYGVIKTIS